MRMERRMLRHVVVGVMVGLVAAPVPKVGATSPPIVLIVMENHEYGSIIGSRSAPYINKTLVRDGFLATNYSAVFHPSLPNYLALTSGSNDGCTSDACPRRSIAADNVFNQLGPDWRAYAQSMPSPCYRGNSGRYAVRHNPPPYYTDLASTCPSQNVPFSALATDLSNGSLPAFSFVTPNLCSDMHDCTVSMGDHFLAANVPQLLDAGAVVIVVWDEGTTDKGGGGHVACIVDGPGVAKGSKDATAYTHYSLLAGIEDALGLPRLAHARGATPVPIP
jgi:hypothetical protein